MSFKETFTKSDGQEQNLQYDDTAFKYFLIAILLTIALPLFIKIILPWLRNPIWNKVKYHCKCESCKKKAQLIFQSNKYNFLTVGYFFKVILTVLIIVGALKMYVSIDQQLTMKRFDPYQILEIENGADIKTIQKAYRQMAIKYHPDKNQNNPEATQKFILVGKAYETLTDEKKKMMYEKYGNPDGPGNFQVAIAMPSFLLKKENQLDVLVVFFICLLIVVPICIMIWYNNANKYDNYGIETRNISMYYFCFCSDIAESYLPYWIINCAHEFSKIQAQPSEMKFLSQLNKNLISQYYPENSKKKLDGYKLKAFVILTCYLLGEDDIIQKYKKDAELIQKLTPQVIQSIIGYLLEQNKVAQFQVPGLQNFLNYYAQDSKGQQKDVKKQQINELNKRLERYQQDIANSVPLIKKLIKLKQQIYQGVSENDYLKQLQFFSINSIKQKIQPKSLFNCASDQRKLDFLKNEEQKLELNKELDYFPCIDVNVAAKVQDFETMTIEDDIVIKVEIIRHHIKQNNGQFILFHSLRYPFFTEEKWHILIINEKNQLIHYKMIQGKDQKLSTSYDLNPQEKKQGEVTFQIIVISDCYLECKVEKELKITIKGYDKEGNKEFVHEEDKELDKYRNFGEKQQRQLQGDNQSDEEESDHDNIEQTNQKIKQTKEEEVEEEEEEEEEEKQKQIKQQSEVQTQEKLLQKEKQE